MQWIETKVIFDFENKQLATDLISNIFYDLGVKGVVVESQEIDILAGWADDEPKPSDDDAVIGYCPKNEDIGKRCQTLENELAHLKAENKIGTRVVYKDIDEEDWAESWKDYFWPEKITHNIVVKPTWREYRAAGDELVLEIDPGMAFGTGTHPTTALCVRMIQRYVRPGDTFLDIGTGSGILMIAAAKLGAASVWGVDSDEVAVAVARDNLLLNRIETERFKVMRGNLGDAVEKRFDLVTANILSEVILVLLDSVDKVLVKNGIFICSGIMEKNRDAVLRKMEDSGFEITETQTKEKWVSIAGRLK